MDDKKNFFDSNSQIFNNSLSNFVQGFASQNAIFHLLECGYLINQISDKLDYPLPLEKVAFYALEYYKEKGIVLFNEPSEAVEKVHYVKEQGRYGKISMRKVVERISICSTNYTMINMYAVFYKQSQMSTYSSEKYIYNELPENLINFTDAQIEHLACIPWPKEMVWIDFLRIF